MAPLSSHSTVMTLAMNTAQQELLGSLARLYHDSTYSDLKITCGGREYKVHKAVVCPRSAFFARACDGDFEEAKTGVIDLPEDDPVAVFLMIQYLYHLDYPRTIRASDQDATGDESVTASGPALPPENEPNLLNHANVYALAGKYFIDGLKGIALEKFEAEVLKHWNSEDFVQAAEVAYNLTMENDPGLRNAVVCTFAQHPTLLHKDSCKTVLKKSDGLAYDILMHTYTKPVNGRDGGRNGGLAVVRVPVKRTTKNSAGAARSGDQTASARPAKKAKRATS